MVDLNKGTIAPGPVRRMKVMALTDNVPLLTAWANDASYEQVFSEQLKNFARKGDVAFAISASGNTPATISAVVSGIGQGSAFGIVLGPNSTVPLINISQNAKVTASVLTNTIAPTKTIAFAIAGPIGRHDLPGLCARVCALLDRSGAAVALCDVAGIVPDAVTVDALARLQLAARHFECQVRLRNASAELRDLIAFMGLRHVVPDDSAGSGLEPRRQAEQREQRLRVEEERELGDPAP